MNLIFIIVSWNQNNTLGEGMFKVLFVFFSECLLVEILCSKLCLSKFTGMVYAC